MIAISRKRQTIEGRTSRGLEWTRLFAYWICLLRPGLQIVSHCFTRVVCLTKIFFVYVGARRINVYNVGSFLPRYSKASIIRTNGLVRIIEVRIIGSKEKRLKTHQISHNSFNFTEDVRFSVRALVAIGYLRRVFSCFTVLVHSSAAY